ncbi:kunitz trypsin inhibitor 3-like [Rutidosis leptorrhynchoides]|uniref:kunitz trypsin inhibitor 3-like n=1 Tax=Rutidosis leptorrhynchoides TaxID=125765 RepID=UPI003A99B693
MNTILTFITFILLHVLIFTTTLSLQTTATAIIYDSSGNKLLRGIPYYILPLLRGTGGGLTLSQTTKNTCPLNVTQEPLELNQGIPFTFNPIILDEQSIHGAYPISIEADVSNPCHESNILKVTTITMKKGDNDEKKKDDDDELLKSKKDNKKKKDDDDDKNVVSVQTVTTGGEFNKPESCFQFVEDVMMPGLQSYQIQQCPFKCGSTSGSSTYSCYNIGIVIDADGKGYLGRTDEIFPVVFTSSYGTFSQSAKVGKFSQPSKAVTFSQSAKAVTFNKPAKAVTFSQSAKVGKVSQPAKAVTFSQPAKAVTFNQPAKAVTFSQSAKVGKFSQPAKAVTFSQPAKAVTFSQSAKVGKFSQPAKAVTVSQLSAKVGTAKKSTI